RGRRVRFVTHGQKRDSAEPATQAALRRARRRGGARVCGLGQVLALEHGLATIRETPNEISPIDLMAGIGATNTRRVLVDDKGQELASEVFQTSDFTGLAGLLNVYLDHRRATDRPKRAALAVAAPILGDEVQMINLDWRFSQASLRKELHLSELIVVN